MRGISIYLPTYLYLPLFDQVVVRKGAERSAAETITKGGIMIPEKHQGKVLQATVGGEIQPVSVKVGNKVLLPEYRGTKVMVGDIVGKYID
ncbi:unnamed protein product [Nyctereutes procyonoides]|uniref:(raccoon dog) hypothetical protein n=1 Tax=Nyctereutes procyonoides TaxID=34880 RepID=A0A811ZJ81_NYCPR|nr:unnamed protein product [Nyctereutes procyonoides]